MSWNHWQPEHSGISGEKKSSRNIREDSKYMISSFEELIKAVKAQSKKTIAIACAGDDVTLEAVREVESMGISECILIDSREKIIRSAEMIGYKVKEENIVEAGSDAEAAAIAVELVRSGKADLPMKGNMQTSDYLRAVLNKEKGLRGKGALSHVAVFEKPQGGLLIITDCAMTINPDLMQKVDLINNAVSVAIGLGCVKAKVAVLSYLETVNVNSQSTTDAAVLSKMGDRGQIKNAVIDGPLAFDNAVFHEAAKHKGIESEVAGQADVLLVPNIEVGNTLYKSLSMMAELKAAGVVAGAIVPVIQAPRADPMESKINSIALSQYLLEKSRQ
jgi:phosphate butyryltransferase